MPPPPSPPPRQAFRRGLVPSVFDHPDWAEAPERAVAECISTVEQALLGEAGMRSRRPAGSSQSASRDDGVCVQEACPRAGVFEYHDVVLHAGGMAACRDVLADKAMGSDAGEVAACQEIRKARWGLLWYREVWPLVVNFETRDAFCMQEVLATGQDCLLARWSLHAGRMATSQDYGIVAEKAHITYSSAPIGGEESNMVAVYCRILRRP